MGEGSIISSSEERLEAFDTFKEDLQLHVDEGAGNQGLYEPGISAARLSDGGLDRRSAGSSEIIKAALSFTGS